MINIIVAYAKNRVIGSNDKIPWNIPGEQKQFKELTTNNIVIMGRKTYESIGKALPNRINYVISRKKYFNDVFTFTSLSEAIEHAKVANVPIIVAINKMDKPSANPERVKEELAKYDLLAEEWGGKTIFVPISAKSGQGVEELLEMIILVSEMNEYKANPNRLGIGTVLEAKLDKGRGPVATLLVKNR